MTTRTPYLYSDTDRHGNQRLYFKPPGWKKLRIRFAAGTKEARREYKRLYDLFINGNDFDGTVHVKHDTIEWLLNQYMASGAWRHDISENTRTQRRNFYKRFCKVHGNVMHAALTPTDLAKVRDGLGPGAGRNFLNSISAAFDWACREDVQLADTNPAKGVKRPRQRTRGYSKWTMDDVVKFKNHYPQGSNPRICLALLLFTSREISGVRELGRADIRNGMIRGYRQKTWADATTPLLHILKEELGERYNDRLWLTANHGGPYSAKSLSQRFSAWADDAGLSGLTSHGLRKSVATILADLGMSERTIMAVLSHTDPRQAQVYVQDANNRKLAVEGMIALEDKVAHFWKGGQSGQP